MTRTSYPQNSKLMMTVTPALLVALLSLSSTTASAESGSYYSDSEHFSAWVHGMPDLDQQRTSLLWGPQRRDGAMYCGPVAASNMLNYLAGENFPGVRMTNSDLEPIVRDEMTLKEIVVANAQDQLKKDLADMVIMKVADEMDTHPENGTDAAAMRSGIGAFLGDDWSVQRFGDKGCRGSSEMVTPGVIFDELDNRHFVIVRFGFYQDSNNGNKTREGGHWIVPTRIFRARDDRRIWWRDSSRDNGTRSNQNPLSWQSAFVTEFSQLERQLVRMYNCSRSRWEVVDYPYSGETYIEDMIVISPPGT